MKTFINTFLGVTLGVVTVATCFNVEAAFAVLVAVGVLIIAVKDYAARRFGAAHAA